MAFKGILDNDLPKSFSVNAKFASSFEAKKRREEIQKAKERAKELELYSGSEVSESEDSSAELLTKKANSKFMNILTMIKKSDPKLKDPSFQAFSDSDFETSSISSEKDQKPVRYKDLLRKQLLNPETEEKDTEVFKEKQVKNEFLAAVNNWEAENQDQNLFKPRKVEKKQEKEDLQELVEEIADSSTDVKALKDYWATPKNEDDLFLKKFLLKKLWKDSDDQLLTYNEIVEQEDEEKANEAEKFETAYNFRFEEEGFEKLKSYPRNFDQSVRKKSESRKTQRELKKEKKTLEKTQRAEEIKRLKNLKKAEIASKMTLIEKFSGVSSTIRPETFEEDFDPAEYDQQMEKMFDDKYYEEPDNPEIQEDDVERVQENDVDVLRIEKTVEIPPPLREGTYEGTWWCCDGCNNGILENHWRFDCQECPNFTLCEDCRSKVIHGHRLKKLKVPLGCAPPQKIIKILCDDCNKDITSDIRYDCEKCEDFTLCEQCFQDTKHPHKLKSVQDLFKELEALDYEDFIAGIPCRFKYRQVKPRDYGLTVDEILEWEDQKLNKLVSLKKIAPYREDDEVKVTKRKKKFIEKSQDKKNKKHEKATRLDSYKKKE